MADFIIHKTDPFYDPAVDYQPSPRPVDCTDISETVRCCNGKACGKIVGVTFLRADEFIKACQDGSLCTHHVKYVIFFGEKTRDGAYTAPVAFGGSLEDNVNEEVLATENQEKIFSALSSLWNLISTWDLKEPITLKIHGSYFRSNDKHLAELAPQKNIMRLAFEEAAFADPFEVLTIAKRLPELEKLRFQVRHMDKHMRNELVNDMRTWKTTLPKLNALTLVGDREPYSRGDERMLEDMREDGVDLLCRELRLLTQQDGKWLFSKVPGRGGIRFLDDPETEFFETTLPIKEEILPLAELFEGNWKSMDSLIRGGMKYGEGVDAVEICALRKSASWCYDL
ncbi:unnamed protein product [Clonostachys solani]|uniref:Uncharacterized protein n=1 Tax=Clonostachys solani TaxID=160281 RepID=A0A9N9WBK9_9HYPO|nr:unnamed protein product [Clonostachys solani]